ncbi:MAG: NUDIX domain-containing protein [Actinomycetota bacterium]|nr:NUDIX domain-containing protein [Actinomycetota bacterium]
MSAVAVILREVTALRPGDEREAASRQRFLDALRRLPRPLDEHADPEHVTASAIVVGRAGTVLHRHKRLGLWLQPGGHIDDGEMPWDAAVREVAEETGLPAAHPPSGPALHHVDAHPGPRGHTHLDLRYLLLAEGKPRPSPGESPDVRWFDLPEAIRVADPGLVGALRRLVAGGLLEDVIPQRRSAP